MRSFQVPFQIFAGSSRTWMCQRCLTSEKTPCTHSCMQRYPHTYCLSGCTSRQRVLCTISPCHPLVFSARFLGVGCRFSSSRLSQRSCTNFPANRLFRFPFLFLKYKTGIRSSFTHILIRTNQKTGGIGHESDE